MILPCKYYNSVQILMGAPHICLQIRYQIFTSFINSHQLKACIQIITKPEMHTGHTLSVKVAMLCQQHSEFPELLIPDSE